MKYPNSNITKAIVKVIIIFIFCKNNLFYQYWNKKNQIYFQYLSIKKAPQYGREEPKMNEKKKLNLKIVVARRKRDSNPWYPEGTTVFKTAAFDRSAISPLLLNCAAKIILFF